ncbi:MAG: zincin-like metallopeptidase domain-containing protein, partial [Candidatus Binatus sp.]|uniref:zincin-like metallopeptidase domain-containing protein n=1 Tax=Candidatus Binatus sp. TaxID=2811406 RepID=UPI003C72E81D
ERITRADAFFSALGIPIVTGGQRACYRPDIDTVFMPSYAHFVDAAGYYSCLGHETGHYADLRIMPRRRAFLRTGAQSRRGMSA